MGTILRLLALLPLSVSLCFCHAAEFQSIAPYLDERPAVAAGEELGIGTARIEGPTQVTVYTYQTVSVVYTAGPAGIAPGGGVRVGIRHVHNWSNPQIESPTREGYLTVAASNPGSVSVTVGGERWFTPYFPWQHMVEVLLPVKGLAPGETLKLTYGDRSGGGPGIRVQPFDETRFTFKVYVDARGQGAFLPIADSPSVEVLPAPFHRLQMVTPSNAERGGETWAIVRTEDRFGNPTPEYQGTLDLRWVNQSGPPIASHIFVPQDQGVFRFEGFRPPANGIAFLVATGEAASAFSNPILVSETRPERLLLWGDLHGHTLFSDGRGTVEEFYDFAENVAGLDFCAVTDHDFQIVDWMWEHSKKVTSAANKPGRFVTFQAYEWSGMSPLGGDHNVFFLEDDPPLFRSRSYYDYRNLQMYHGPDPQVNHIEDLYSKLVSLYDQGKVFCIPHYGGRQANPVFHNPRVQRMIEVFSEHRRSEDWMTPFLANGHRLGIMASTDGHYGNPGYGYLKPSGDWDTQEIGMAAVAVYARERTRESIFEALFDRRVYATSGDRIVMELNVDGHPMGSEFRSEKAPTLAFRAVGTDLITVVQIKKNGESVASIEPKKSEVEWTWTDPSYDPDVTSYYYVRLIQDNGEEAITSPVWVDPVVPR